MVKNIYKTLEELEKKFNSSSKKEQELLEEKLLDIVKNIVELKTSKTKESKND